MRRTAIYWLGCLLLAETVLPGRSFASDAAGLATNVRPSVSGRVANRNATMPTPRQTLEPTVGSFLFVRTLVSASSNGSWIPTCRFVFERARADGSRQTLQETDFQAWLIPDTPICIFVHGSFMADGELEQFQRIDRWLRSAAPARPLNVLFYRWPSDPGMKVLMLYDAIAELGQRAERHGFCLAQLLTRLPATQRVCIVAHSHGTRTVATALHLLAGGTVRGARLPITTPSERKYRLIFSAAAIDRDWLDPGAKYGRALSLVDSLINMWSHDDLPLSFYPLRKPFGQYALGQGGLSRWDRLLMGKENRKVIELDMTHLVGSGHAHANYVAHPEIAFVLKDSIFFTDTKSLSRRQP